MKALSILGSGSGAGKSWITTALGAWLHGQGIRVAPIKAQNMSNNAWVNVTAAVATDVLDAADVRISMDGKGRWIDNVFIERRWRSVKYEDVHLRAYENGREVQAGLTRYFDFYNRQQIHQSHEYQTPDEIYYATKADEPLAIAA